LSLYFLFKAKFYILIIPSSITYYTYLVIQMTMAEARVKRWGNSFGIVIPREIVKMENIAAGDVIKIEISKSRPLDGFGMFSGIAPFDGEDDQHGGIC
jgi:hypothetical protein